MKISSFFVAFLEKMNFTNTHDGVVYFKVLKKRFYCPSHGEITPVKKLLKNAKS